MRVLLLTTAFIVLSPLAYSQTSPQTMGGSSPPFGPTATGTTNPSGAAMARQGGTENCGTPDEPKACPPMPRHPLQRYPDNKQ